MNHDDPKKNAEEYATRRASNDKDRMAIKSTVCSWSDDFYPASSKMFSNVQKMSLNKESRILNPIHQESW